MAKQNSKGAANNAPKSTPPAPAVDANANQKTPEQIAAEQAAADRAALIKKLQELGWPSQVMAEDLTNEELQAAIDAHALVANQGEQAGAQVTQIVTNAIANQPQAGTGQPKNNLEHISNMANKEKVPALFIKSVPESFCRCGRRFTREGYGIALDVLTDEEIQRLKDEPNLVVEEVDALID